MSIFGSKRDPSLSLRMIPHLRIEMWGTHIHCNVSERNRFKPKILESGAGV
jgi:hypothetical protein